MGNEQSYYNEDDSKFSMDVEKNVRSHFDIEEGKDIISFLKEKNINILAYTCAYCFGSGWCYNLDPKTEEKTEIKCDKCDGKGIIDDNIIADSNIEETESICKETHDHTCTDCSGTGWCYDLDSGSEDKIKCNKCDGKGISNKYET